MANCVCEVYLTQTTFHTAVELVDDAKLLSAFAFIEDGKTKFCIVKKT